MAIPLLISTVILDIENYEQNTESKNRVRQESILYLYTASAHAVSGMHSSTLLTTPMLSIDNDSWVNSTRLKPSVCYSATFHPFL